MTTFTLVTDTNGDHMPEPSLNASRPDPKPILRWLRANGVTENAHEIAADGVTVEDGWINYTVVMATGSGMPHRDPRRIQQRVAFHEANP